MVCKPALALAAVSKALAVLMDNEEALRNVSEEMGRSLAVQELRLASAFLGEASIGIIRLVARVMLSSGTVKRAVVSRPRL